MPKEGNMVRDDILQFRRHYFIDKVKKPLLKALILLADRFLEPTRENTRKQNTHVLLGIWDEFFEYEDNPGRDALFRTIKKLIVDVYEHDDYYSTRIDWFLGRLFKKYLSREWLPLKPWYPSRCWLEPTVLEEKKKVVRELLKDQKLHGTGFLSVS